MFGMDRGKTQGDEILSGDNLSPDVVISPDTRRENRVPPGQSRTKKWPVLDAHGAPPIDLATWSFEVEGLVENNLKFSLDEFLIVLPDVPGTSFF